ncbi:MAG: ATP--guanido phosphotransferase [Defluviitaleaceae bacterium]|nr:ATP--guanido phosphotransferase [Defluviitaleaceae bacterium]
MSNWYESMETDTSPIISSRVRLARNLEDYPFSACITEAQSADMITKVKKAAPDFNFIELAKENTVEQMSMVENHDISPEILSIGTKRPVGLLKCDIPNTVIMLGEEDHIRIQAITPGDDLESAYKNAAEVDDRLESGLKYAYHKDFGYLTSCPTNTGTGLRASFMVHIPMLEKTGNLQRIVTGLSKLGMTFRGIYGEGSKPFGSIYQLSNQVTLGKSEEEIINTLNHTCEQLKENEHILLKNAFINKPIEMEDMIFRALGLLSHARKLTVNEAMESLSAIRVGILSGILSKKEIDRPIYSIMMNIEPGNLQKRAGAHLSENDIRIERAKYLREIFKV